MRAFEAVAFDLDGTLIRSRHDYGEMARRAKTILEEEGVPEAELDEPRKIWRVIRGGMGSLGGLGLRPERRRLILRRINEALNEVEQLSIESVESAPGAHEAMRLIRARGLKIGVATRAGRPYAERSLEITGLAENVHALLARDEVEHPKPDPRHLLELARALDTPLERILYVGDTMTDLTTAKAAGVSFVGFAGNEEWVERMREAGCYVFISDIREIIEVVDSNLDPSTWPNQ